MLNFPDRTCIFIQWTIWVIHRHLTPTKIKQMTWETKIFPAESIREGDHCLSNEFSCSNDECIPREAVCDNTDDCRNAEDEQNCSCKNDEVRYQITILFKFSTSWLPWLLNYFFSVLRFFFLYYLNFPIIFLI